MSPRRASSFLSRRRKKGTKERATLLSATPSLRYGATWGARSRGAPQNSLRAGALRSNSCGDSVHEAWAPRTPARAMRWPVGLFGCSAPHPCWLRLRRGGCGAVAGRLRGGTRVGARVLRCLTRRGCPSGAAQQQSEFHGAPRNRHAAGLPRSAAKGSQTGGRLLFGNFLLARQEKVTAPPGALPGSRPQPRHVAQNRERSALASTSSARTDGVTPKTRGATLVERNTIAIL
jgi:hypothetical protein